MNRFLFLLLAVSTSVHAADKSGTSYWPDSQLKAYSQQLAPKVNADRVALERLGDFGSHYVLVVHREGNGPAELHENETDFYVVQSGEGSLQTGGEIVDAKTTEPGEVRGSSIRDGKSVKLKPGDTVNIPPKTAHQIVLEPGQKITYMIVKIRGK